MEMDIINLTQYADALRSTGYKNIESAISEIVDNSVEAKAKNIFIIIKETKDDIEGKNKVTEIAFLDNGKGMDKNLVQGCLRIGYGTRTAREGIGRFGVGLPQASMHVCPLVEVYSWQDYETPYKSYLDINKIKSGEQISINDPIQEDVPEEYKKYLSYKLNDYSLDNQDISFKRNGTLVIWKNCDNVMPRKAATLTERLVFELGKKFRHVINEKKSSIYVISDKKNANPRRVKPNDPLLLMEDNYILGNSEQSQCMNWIKDDESFNEPIFEVYTGKNNEFPNGIVEKEIKFRDKESNEIKKSIIKVKFSIVREEFYGLNQIKSGGKQPGDGDIGKEIRKLEGISIVRVGREIDFGKFDFYSSVNMPVHRWWGCEISFGTELDEVFGVANNKQHVELIEVKKEDLMDDDEVKPIWVELKDLVQKAIKDMVARNRELRKHSKTINGMPKSEAESVIDSIETGNKKTSSDITQNENKETAIEVAKEILDINGIKDPSDIDIKEILDRKVNFIYENNSSQRFFDIEVERGVSKCIINENHIMYKKFLKNIEENPNLSTCFELFIGALVRVKDEMIQQDKKIIFDEILEDWNAKLTMFITRFANS